MVLAPRGAVASKCAAKIQKIRVLRKYFRKICVKAVKIVKFVTNGFWSRSGEKKRGTPDGVPPDRYAKVNMLYYLMRTFLTVLPAVTM